METALIFGANGFVGPYLSDELMSNGYRVIASDIADNPKPTLHSDTFFQCNLLNSAEVEEAIKKTKPEIIINLAAMSSVGQSWVIPQKTMMVNMIGPLNIMEAAKELDASTRILSIGSSEEYAPSMHALNENSPLLANNPYGISKIGQEQLSHIYSERYGIESYHVRAFNHTGIGQTDVFVLPSFCNQVATIETSGKSGSIAVGNIDVKRDFSDVRDVVRAYRLLLESDYSGSVFNIGSGVAYSLRELLQFIISNCSQSIAIEVDPARFRPADNPVICCDNNKARTLLKWEPQYSIFDTLKSMILFNLQHPD